MQEKWLDIPNYKGYQVSNTGYVRTYNKVTYTERHGERKWENRVLKFKGKNVKTGHRVDLWKNGKPKTFLVARLVAFTFYNKNIEDGNLTVNHLDGNRFNNNINNLEVVTLKENIRHAFRTGLQPTQIKIKITDKITGSIIFPSSLSDGGRLISKNNGYLSDKISKDIFENDRYQWEFI